jgi:hypothetical protein
VSRNQQRLDQLAGALTDEGHTARGYAANVRNPRRSRPPSTRRPRLPRPVDGLARDLGTFEVLEYSPLPQEEFLRPVL